MLLLYTVRIILTIKMTQEFKSLTFRLPESELLILKAYCDQEGRKQTDIIRELIRGLKSSLKP